MLLDCHVVSARLFTLELAMVVVAIYDAALSCVAVGRATWSTGQVAGAGRQLEKQRLGLRDCRRRPTGNCFGVSWSMFQMLRR